MNENDKTNLTDALKNFLTTKPEEKADLSDAKIMELLIEETLKFRDKMKNEAGYTVSVEDTQIALKAVDAHVQNQRFPDQMTKVQTALAKLMIDRLILLKYNL